MVTKIPLVNIKGDKGDKGDDGSQGDKGDTGAPGVNAIPADEYIADRMLTPGTATEGALAGKIEAARADLHPDYVGYDLVLLMGQSNVVGGDVDTVNLTYLDPPSERVKQWPGSGPYMGQIISAIDPLWHLAQSATVGPGAPFGREYVKRVTENRTVLLVACGRGSTGFVPSGGFTWDPADTATATNLFNNAMGQGDAALVAAGPNSRIAGVVWVQGENDAASLNQAQYAAKLDSLIDATRAHFGAPDLPFVIGQMVPQWIAANAATYGPINAAHIDTPRRKTRTAFSYGATGTDAVIASGPIHYSAAGNRRNGAAMADALVRLASENVLGTPPARPASVALTQSGTSVAVKLDRAPGRVTDYVVQYSTNGGSSWSTVTRSMPLDVNATITGLALGQAVQVRAATVNEVGTSAYTDPVSLTLVNAPAQPTSLSAGTPGSTSVDLTWEAPGGATGQRIEVSTDSGATWSTRKTVGGAVTATTVTGLIPSTAQRLRVVASNPAGDGTPSAYVSLTTDTLPMLLSAVAVAAFRGYSTRRLSSTYAGQCLRVRRSSDSVEQDIGFVGDVLDVAGMLTFLGGQSGFVAKWYDQSGNTRDLTQATAGAQPRIALAGSVDLVNGLPAVKFDGLDDFLESPTVGLYAAGAATVAGIVKAAGSNFTPAAEFEAASVNGSTYKLLGSSGTLPQYQLRAATNVHVVAGNQNAFNDIAHSVIVADTGSSVSAQVDGIAAITGSTYTRSGTVTLTRFTVGASGYTPVTGFWTGSISELVYWPAALSGANQTAAQTNQKAYFGTP